MDLNVGRFTNREANGHENAFILMIDILKSFLDNLQSLYAGVLRKGHILTDTTANDKGIIK